MKNFNYMAPESLKEAINLLSQRGKRVIAMAGGTDLLIVMRNREIEPGNVVDLKRIPDISNIEYTSKKGLRIGALAKISDIENSRIIQEHFNILSQAAGALGSVQVRNKATIGGNLCHAAPSADMAPALITLGAKVKINGEKGETLLPLEEFFKGPGKTVLKHGELLTEIRVPNMANFSEGVYLKFGPRRAMDLAIVGVACILTMDPSSLKCLDVRIALGAVAPTPMRAKRAEALIMGQKLTQSIIMEAARSASKEAKPISDIRASEWYRREIIEVLVSRAINQVLDKIKRKGRG